MSAENPLESNNINEENDDEVRIATPVEEMEVKCNEMLQNLEGEVTKVKNQEGSRQEKEKLIKALEKKFTKEFDKIKKEANEAIEIDNLVKLKKLYKKVEEEEENLIGDFIIERNIRKLEGK